MLIYKMHVKVNTFPSSLYNVKHPNIAVIEESFVTTHHGEIFILQQPDFMLFNLKNYRELSSFNKTSPKDIFGFMQTLHSSVRELHKAGIVLRNFQPSKMLINMTTFTPFIYDFSSINIISTQCSFTFFPEYFSPEEQLAYEEGSDYFADPIEDYFKMGRLMYYIMFGHNIFTIKPDNYQEMITQKIHFPHSCNKSTFDLCNEFLNIRNHKDHVGEYMTQQIRVKSTQYNSLDFISPTVIDLQGNVNLEEEFQLNSKAFLDESSVSAKQSIKIESHPNQYEIEHRPSHFSQSSSSNNLQIESNPIHNEIKNELNNSSSSNHLQNPRNSEPIEYDQYHNKLRPINRSHTLEEGEYYVLNEGKSNEMKIKYGGDSFIAPNGMHVKIDIPKDLFENLQSTHYSVEFESEHIIAFSLIGLFYILTITFLIFIIFACRKDYKAIMLNSLNDSPQTQPLQQVNMAQAGNFTHQPHTQYVDSN